MSTGPSDRSAPDRTYAIQAAVIEGWEFDRTKFRVVGSTYRAADPAHWLALDLETSIEDGLPWSYTFESEVTDITRQKIANRDSFVVNPAEGDERLG